MFLDPSSRPTDLYPTLFRARPDASPAAKAAHTTGLLSLLRKVFDYGKEVIAVLQRQTPYTVEHVGKVALRFGTPNIKLIAQRVMRGLHLALALKDRLTGAVAPPPPAPARAAPPRQSPHPPRPVPAYRRPAGRDRDDAIAASEAADDAALLKRLPTAKEIAARMLRRSIGTVIAEICLDLGITPSHPLWQKLRLAATCNGGRFTRLIRITTWRVLNASRRFPHVFREPALALTAAGRPPDAPAEQDADVAAILRVAATATGPP
jgi:hypothetical protein